jgi:hypothetical protein
MCTPGRFGVNGSYATANKYIHIYSYKEYAEKVYNIDKNIISIQEEQTALNIFLINFANDFNISTLFVFINSLNLKVFGYLQNLFSII